MTDMEDGARTGPLKSPYGTLKGAQRMQDCETSEFLLIPFIKIKEMRTDV